MKLTKKQKKNTHNLDKTAVKYLFIFKMLLFYNIVTMETIALSQIALVQLYEVLFI